MPFDGSTILLIGDQTRRAACELVQRAPEGWVVTLDKPRRTLRQSSKFWAMCSTISKSGYEWSGTTHSKDHWHDLLLSGWHIVKEQPPRLLIGIEGERVSLMKHSRWLSESDMGDLLDYCTAWAVMHGIDVG